MMVNISWLLRHSPQTQRAAVSDGCFCFQITGPGAATLFTRTARLLATSRGRSQEYDSGNDTSSPPSMQISSARSRGQEKESPTGGLSKSRGPNSGNTSDSGNSFTTSSPQNEGAALENLSPTSRGRESRSVHLGGRRGSCLSSTISVSHPSPTPHTQTPALLFERKRERLASFLKKLSKEISFRYSWIQGLKKYVIRNLSFLLHLSVLLPPLLALFSSRSSQSIGKDAIQLTFYRSSQPMEGKCLFPENFSRISGQVLIDSAWPSLGHLPTLDQSHCPGDAVFLARTCRMPPSGLMSLPMYTKTGECLVL